MQEPRQQIPHRYCTKLRYFLFQKKVLLAILKKMYVNIHFESMATVLRGITEVK